MLASLCPFPDTQVVRIAWRGICTKRKTESELEGGAPPIIPSMDPERSHRGALGKPRPCPWPAPGEAKAGQGALPAPEEDFVTGHLRPFWGALLSRLFCSGCGPRNHALERCEAELGVWIHFYSPRCPHQMQEAWRRG